MNPVTGQFLGPNTAVFVGTLVPSTRATRATALFAAGQGIAKTSYTFPKLVVGPRFGMAYDVTGDAAHGGARGRRHVLRPAASRRRPGARRQHGRVRDRALFAVAEPGHRRVDHAGRLVDHGVRVRRQAADRHGVECGRCRCCCPWATSLDAAYTGRHNYNAQVGGQDFPININTIDLGTAFNPALQDPTLAPSAIPGASSLAAQNPNQVRGYRGYGTIQLRQYDGWRKFHSLELAVNRRFRNGLQFGFNDTIVLSDVLGVDPRYDHGPDGQVVLRADQAEAQELLGNQHTPTAQPAGDVRVATARHRQVHRQPGAQGPRADRERLAALGDLDGHVGQRLYRDAAVPDRQRQREPDRLARLRAAHPHRRRSGDRVQQRHLPAVQHGGVPGTAGRERGAGVGERLSVRLLPERARSVDRPQHPAGRQPDSAAARGHVQRAQRGRHHRRANTHASADQSGRSGRRRSICRSTPTATSCPTACGRTRRALGRSRRVRRRGRFRRTSGSASERLTSDSPADLSSAGVFHES